MRIRVLILLMLLISVLSSVGSVHAMPGMEGQKKSDVTAPGHGASISNRSRPQKDVDNTVPTPKGMAGVIKDATLPGYDKMKIGEAFEKYQFFKKKEWRETNSANGKIYVDFTGYFPSSLFDFKSIWEGVSARGIEVKFVIYPNGAYGLGMASKVEVNKDGKVVRYPLAEAKSVLDAIYANKKINQ